MESPRKYTAYRRVSTISIFVYWGLWIAYVVWFGNLMDRYPDLDDFLIIFMTLALIWGPFFVGQLASRFQRMVSIKANGDVVIDAVNPNSVIRDEYPVITLAEITDISVHHGLFTGNYIAIELHGYTTVKLYSKRYLFSHTEDFFDLYVALKNAWNTRENKEREHFRIAREQEGFAGVEHPALYSEAIAPNAAAEKEVPSTLTSTPIPHTTEKIRSAIRNYNEYGREYETGERRPSGGNGILVVAIVFCVFLLGMASLISSYDVPEELAGFRETLYTMLVLIGLVLGGIAVVAVVKSRNGEPQ